MLRPSARTPTASELSRFAQAASAFDDGKTTKPYKATLPKDIPETNFWSFTLYDNQTRSMLTPQRYPRAGSQSYPSPAAEASADGTTTIYFGSPMLPQLKKRTDIPQPLIPRIQSRAPSGLPKAEISYRVGDLGRGGFTTRWYQFCFCDIVSMVCMSMHGVRTFIEPVFIEDDMAKKAKKAKKTTKAATKKVAKKTSKKKK